MSTTTTGDLEVVIPEGADVEVVEVKGKPTEVEVNSPVKDLEVTISKKGEVSGKSLTDSEISVEAASNKKTVTVELKSSFKKSDISVDKGKLDLTVTSSKFSNSTVTAGKKADSITFGSNTKVIKATVEMGKGSDTVTFKSGTKFKGKTTIDLGKGGKDAVVIEDPVVIEGAKKITVDNFTKKDSISVAGETFDYKDIKNGAEIPGVKVNLA